METNSTSKLESRAYINGSFVSSLTQPPTTIKVHSPSTNSLVGHVEAASSLDVDAAVSAATSAFHGPWSSFKGSERAACLNKFADLFETIAPRVAEVESLSMGAPIAAQAGRLVPNAVKTFRYYAGQAYGALQGESWPVDDDEDAYRVFRHAFPFHSHPISKIEERK
jgi:aldehyde dehydrogenase (NAD+)